MNDPKNNDKAPAKLEETNQNTVEATDEELDHLSGARTVVQYGLPD